MSFVVAASLMTCLQSVDSATSHLEEFLRNNTVVDEDPGWSDVDQWIHPKMPKEHRLTLLREKRDANRVLKSKRKPASKALKKGNMSCKKTRVEVAPKLDDESAEEQDAPSRTDSPKENRLICVYVYIYIFWGKVLVLPAAGLLKSKVCSMLLLYHQLPTVGHLF